LLGGVLSLVLLSLHGAAYLQMKTDGPLQARAHQAVGVLWWVAIVGIVAIVVASFAVRPDFTQNFVRWPWLTVGPIAALAAIVKARRSWARRAERETFFATSALIAGLLASVFTGLFPRLLPALEGSPHPGLDIYNAAAPLGSMQIALGIYLVGMTIVLVYLVHIYRVWRGKVAEGASYQA
jgi:cytochrome bd ubiquinol oxidase subunit II